MSEVELEPKGSILLESELSAPLGERECWHCKVEKKLCLTVVVLGESSRVIDQPCGGHPASPSPPPPLLRVLLFTSRASTTNQRSTLSPWAGASGDLASKKTFPALQFLFRNG